MTSIRCALWDSCNKLTPSLARQATQAAFLQLYATQVELLNSTQCIQLSNPFQKSPPIRVLKCPGWKYHCYIEIIVPNYVQHHIVECLFAHFNNYKVSMMKCWQWIMIIAFFSFPCFFTLMGCCRVVLMVLRSIISINADRCLFVKSLFSSIPFP